MLQLNNSNYYFSSLRSGLATAGELPAGAKRPLVSLDVTATAKSRGAAAIHRKQRVEVNLYGPGEVVGFDAGKMIQRVGPHDNNTHFNPDEIPFIEFKEADFLWRYSGAPAPIGGWQPWLCLLILKQADGLQTGEFTFQPAAKRKLPPQIQLAADVPLPDLSANYRWAHVHLTGRSGLSHAAIENTLRRSPAKAVCRLLGPRRLEANTAYSAFVVPAFHLGVLAGKGEVIPADAAANVPAWTGNALPANTRLPYYYHWDFRCGARGGFEDLAKAIQPTALGQSGGPLFSIHHPGYQIDDLAGSTHMLTALEPLGTTKKTQFSADLAAVLNQGEEIVNPDRHQADRKVVPPIYGRWYAAGANSRVTLDPAAVDSHWLEELNLDPRFRLVAGMGAEFVKKNQEGLLAEAWQQYSVVREENQRLRLGRFGNTLARCLYKRLKHVQREDQLMRITSPLHQQVQLEEAQTISHSLDEKAAPNLLFKGKTMQFSRKLSGKNGLQSVPMVTLPPTIDSLGPGTFHWSGSILVALNSPDINQVLAEESTSLTQAIDPAKTIMAKAAEHANPLRQWATIKRAEQEALATPEVSITMREDVLTPIKWYPQFHAPVYEHLRDLSPDLIIPGLAEMPQNSVAVCQVNRAFVEAFLLGVNHEFAAELRWREFPTDLRGSYFRNFWDKTIHSLDTAERELFKVSTYGQRLLEDFKVAQPDLQQQYNTDSKRWAFLISTYEKDALSDLELDIVELYEEAVENWLLTREEDKDVLPLHQWAGGDLLGEHHRDQSDNSQLVLLMRAMLFQKYPNLLIYLFPKSGNGTSTFAESERKYPVFEGQLPPDIEFLGFPPVANPGDYLLVFEERVGLQRYGLDAGIPSGTTANDLDDLSWGHFNVAPGAYLDNLQPSRNEAVGNWTTAAYAARAFTQKPVRYVMELTQFLSPA